MGLSQAALGREIGLPDETASTRINRYERGVSEPDLRTAEAMAKALGVSLSYLLAPDDRTAQLLKAFDGLSAAQKDKAIALVQKLTRLAAAEALAKKAARKRPNVAPLTPAKRHRPPR